MLKLKNVYVSFSGNHILKNLSCEVEKGDFIVIVGGNGAGKSTLFNTIAGKVAPSSGNIFLDGIDITNFDELKRSSMITRIFQDVQLNSVGSFTVAENLALSKYSRRRPELVSGTNCLSQEDAEQLITSLGMDLSILKKQMSSLSGGQRQLISFAMATQLIPKILLLDEPTAALDPQAATKLLQHAIQFIKKNNITTLLITHDPYIALNIGNKIWVLEKGEIVKQFIKKDEEIITPDQLIGNIDYALLSSLSL